jgi:hypothetical protein
MKMAKVPAIDATYKQTVFKKIYPVDYHSKAAVLAAKCQWVVVKNENYRP